MPEDPLSPEILSYYARENRKRVEAIEAEGQSLRVFAARIEGKIDGNTEKIQDVNTGLKATRRLMTTLMVTIATGAVGFAFTVLLAVGKI